MSRLPWVASLSPIMLAATLACPATPDTADVTSADSSSSAETDEPTSSSSESTSSDSETTGNTSTDTGTGTETETETGMDTGTGTETGMDTGDETSVETMCGDYVSDIPDLMGAAVVVNQGQTLLYLSTHSYTCGDPYPSPQTMMDWSVRVPLPPMAQMVGVYDLGDLMASWSQSTLGSLDGTLEILVWEAECVVGTITNADFMPADGTFNAIVCP